MVYADKASTVSAIDIDFLKAFDSLTQHSSFKAEEAFQLTSENTKLGDSQEISLALWIKHRGMESILHCLKNAFVTLDATLKESEL